MLFFQCYKSGAKSIDNSHCQPNKNAPVFSHLFSRRPTLTVLAKQNIDQKSVSYGVLMVQWHSVGLRLKFHGSSTVNRGKSFHSCRTCNKTNLRKSCY